jgi:hypothetical protein
MIVPAFPAAILSAEMLFASTAGSDNHKQTKMRVHEGTLGHIDEQAPWCLRAMVGLIFMILEKNILKDVNSKIVARMDISSSKTRIVHAYG